MNKDKNVILELTVEFVLKIIHYTELLEQHHKYIIARQLLKAGTSIGANVREAQQAESKADFIHKLKVAIKEAYETEYWLLLCNKAYSYKNCGELMVECDVIIKILSKIISSTKNNLKEEMK